MGPSISLHALRYGVGCFETMRGEPASIKSDGIPFLSDHLERLYDGIRYLTGIHHPESIDSYPAPKTWIHNLNRLAEHATLTNVLCVIRFQVWIEDHLGFHPDPAPDIHHLIEIREYTSCSESSTKTHTPQRNEPVDLCFVPHQTVPTKSRPAHLKLSNMLHYRDAFRTALSFGASDAILCSCDGYLAETAIANLFWYQNGTVFTPSPDTHILPGITRNRLLAAFRKEGIPCEEGRYTPDALEHADAVWVTNSLREILPVGSIVEALMPPEVSSSTPATPETQTTPTTPTTSTRQTTPTQPRKTRLIKRYAHHPILDQAHECFQQAKKAQ